MSRKLTAAVSFLIVVVAVGVLVGVQQGSGPPTAKLSASAELRERQRVTAGSPAVQTGKEAFASQHCGNCHTLAASNTNGNLGPRLDVVLRRIPRTAIEGFITNPENVQLPGYDNNLMPRNYATRLTAGQIRALASYLHAAAG